MRVAGLWVEKGGGLPSLQFHVRPAERRAAIPEAAGRGRRDQTGRKEQRARRLGRGYHRCVSLISAMTWPALRSAWGQEQANENEEEEEQGGREGRHLEHVGGLLAPLGHVLGLSQQAVEKAGAVELADELALEAVLDVVDQEVHDGLGHAAGGREEGRGQSRREQGPGGGRRPNERTRQQPVGQVRPTSGTRGGGPGLTIT